MSLLPLPDLIDVPEAPAIPGLLFRHFRGESDYPAMVRLTNERAAFNGDEYNMTIEELADDYKPGEHFDPAVIEVAGVADQSEFQRAGARPPAEPDPLDVPPHEHRHPLVRHASNLSSRERSLLIGMARLGRFRLGGNTHSFSPAEVRNEEVDPVRARRPGGDLFDVGRLHGQFGLSPGCGDGHTDCVGGHPLFTPRGDDS